MTTINLYYHNGVFVPYMDNDREIADALQKDRPYRCKINDDRNPQFLAKYHKLIDIVWSNLSDEQQEIYRGSRTAFRHSIEMAAGCIEPIYDFRTQQMSYCRTSISFDTMSEKDFSDFYERAKDIIINKVLRRCKDNDYLYMIQCF